MQNITTVIQLKSHEQMPQQSSNSDALTKQVKYKPSKRKVFVSNLNQEAHYSLAIIFFVLKVECDEYRST
jgi:hypothetical protein